MLTLIRLLLPIAVVVLQLVLAILPAHAQPARMPTEAELNAQRGAMPRVPDAPSLQGRPGLADLAEQHERMRRGADAGSGDQAERTASGLLVFASLGMPAPSLQTLIADAERARALLVLRGVQESSLRKTTERIEQLMGGKQVAWNIDPALFDRFGVKTVPTTVLVDPRRPVLVDCGDGSRCQGTAFSKVAGDVTIEHALRTIAQEDAEFRVAAEAFLGRLAMRAAQKP